MSMLQTVLTHKPQQHAEWTFVREKHGKRIWFSEDVSLQSRRNEVLSDGSHKRSHFLGWKSNPDLPESEKKRIFLAWFLIHALKPSLSSQWSLVRSFVRDFVCISFVWLTSLWEQSHTKLMQKKSRMKLRTRLHWLERLGLTLKIQKYILNCYLSRFLTFR